MSIFNKTKQKKKMSWDDITLRQYLSIQRLDYSSETAFLDIIEIVYGEDILKLPIEDFKREMQTKSEDLVFMNEQPVPGLPKKVYTINGHRYVLDLKKVSTAQFIDFSNLMRRNNMPEYLPRLISLFLLKEGEEYGEYDIDEEVRDIESMPVTEALSIAVFFKSSYLIFLRNFLYFSEQRIKKLKLPKAEKEEMVRATRKAILSAYYL